MRFINVVVIECFECRVCVVDWFYVIVVVVEELCFEWFEFGSICVDIY